MRNLLKKSKLLLLGLFLLTSSLLAVPVEISTWAELAAISGDGSYILVADLNSSSEGYDTYAGPSANGGAGWIPLNWWVVDFNGDEHSISDLYISAPTSDFQGLFAGIQDGSTIYNLQILNVDMTAKYFLGALAGYEKAATVYNVKTTGTISGNACVGGCLGALAGGTISNCYSSANCTGSTRAGGFIGDMDNVASNADDCWCNGTVGGGSPKGFISLIHAGTVTNCFWDTETSGCGSSAGGTGKTTAQMKDYDTFNDAGWDVCAIGDFDPGSPTTWFIDDGNDYPRLWFEYEGGGGEPVYGLPSQSSKSNFKKYGWYKVVQYVDISGADSALVHAEIYSTRTNSWHNIGMFPSPSFSYYTKFTELTENETMTFYLPVFWYTYWIFGREYWSPQWGKYRLVVEINETKYPDEERSLDWRWTILKDMIGNEKRNARIIGE